MLNHCRRLSAAFFRMEMPSFHLRTGSVVWTPPPQENRKDQRGHVFHRTLEDLQDLILPPIGVGMIFGSCFLLLDNLA